MGCRVVPAILANKPEDLRRMVEQANSFATWVQFDIMDGNFVPSRSIGWEHLSTLKIDFGWEAHLMVNHPEEYLEGFFKAGARRVVFHYEATSSPKDIIALIKGFGLEVGLALNPETKVSSIVNLVDEVDSVLLLSVHPGFYGQKFLPEVLGKVGELRQLKAGLEIGIDGGIKEGNILEVAQAGVNSIYIGSAIFLSQDPGESFRRLEAKVCGEVEKGR